MPGSGSYCAIVGCYNSSGKAHKAGIQMSFHKFPRDPALRKIWIKKCRRADEFNSNNARICSDHFAPEDYEPDCKYRYEMMGIKTPRKLRPNTVPSLKLPRGLVTPILCTIEKKREKIKLKEKKFVPVLNVISDFYQVHNALTKDTPTATKTETPTESVSLLSTSVTDTEPVEAPIVTESSHLPTQEHLNSTAEEVAPNEAAPVQHATTTDEDMDPLGGITETNEPGDPSNETGENEPLSPGPSMNSFTEEVIIDEHDVVNLPSVTSHVISSSSDATGDCDELKSKVEGLEKALKETEIQLYWAKRLCTQFKKEARRRTLRNQELRKKYSAAALKSEHKKIQALEATEKKHNEIMSALNQLFTENQLKLIQAKQTKVHWTSEEIGRAFTLRSLSKEAYLFVRDELKYPLPGLSSLKRWARSMRIDEPAD